MGAEPYEYVVEYEENLASVLGKLRQRVFETGEYRGAELEPANPEEAVRLGEVGGTSSILDIVRLSDEPEWRSASPLVEEELEYYFGTTEPSVNMVRRCSDLWNDIERGTARCVICYESGIPTKIVFLGYSFD